MKSQRPNTTSRSRLAILSLMAGLAILARPSAQAATPLYSVGDIVADFSLVNRATGKPVALSEFSGKIVVLDWFAWWCPFCQAAAPQLLTGIDEWYDTRGGNPSGIPVLHIGVNLQPNQETQTQNFVERAKLPLVLQDFDRQIASRIASSGQPIFAIINGVTNSPSHRPWELLYSRQGYGQTQFPVAEFRKAIDAVKTPPPPLILSSPAVQSDGQFGFQISGVAGTTYELQTTKDLIQWTPIRTFTSTGSTESLLVDLNLNEPGSYFRLVVVTSGS